MLRRNFIQSCLALLIPLPALIPKKLGWKVVKVIPEKSWIQVPTVFELQGVPLPIVSSSCVLNKSDWIELDKTIIEAYRRISQEYAEEIEMTILYGSNSPQVKTIHERRRKRAIKNRLGNRVEHYRRLNANNS